MHVINCIHVILNNTGLCMDYSTGDERGGGGGGGSYRSNTWTTRQFVTCIETLNLVTPTP